MNSLTEYKLRPGTIEDFKLSYEIRKNALGEYVKQTWGWDEKWQLGYHKQDFNQNILQIIEVDGKPVGTLESYIEDNILIISGLYIIDTFQRQAIGGRIMKSIVKEADSNNLTVKLKVLKVNPRAKKFYIRFGFEVNEEDETHYKMVYQPAAAKLREENSKGKICKNCGAVAEDKFCPNCGQKTEVHRYTVKHIVHDFFHSFTHVDTGILYLIKELSLRPGTVAREYIEGKRKKYFSPMQYLIIGIAVITFLSINLNLGTSIMGNVNITGGGAEHFRAQFIPFFYKYFNIFQFITVPIMTFYSWLFFRKSGFNYAENLIFNTFLIAQRHLFFLFFIPLLYIFPQNANNIISVHFFIWMVYLIYAYIQFYKPKKKLWLGIKSFIVIYLFLLSQTAVLVAIFFILFYKKPA